MTLLPHHDTAHAGPEALGEIVVHAVNDVTPPLFCGITIEAQQAELRQPAFSLSPGEYGTKEYGDPVALERAPQNWHEPSVGAQICRPNLVPLPDLSDAPSTLEQIRVAHSDVALQPRHVERVRKDDAIDVADKSGATSIHKVPVGGFEHPLRKQGFVPQVATQGDRITKHGKPPLGQIIANAEHREHLKRDLSIEKATRRPQWSRIVERAQKPSERDAQLLSDLLSRLRVEDPPLGETSPLPQVCVLGDPAPHEVLRTRLEDDVRGGIYVNAQNDGPSLDFRLFTETI